MSARKQLEREVQRLVTQATTAGLLDKISIEHAKTAMRMLKLMSLSELANVHTHLTSAIERGVPLKVRSNR